MQEKIQRLNEIANELSKSIPNDNLGLFKEFLNIIQENLIEMDFYMFHIFKLENSLKLYMLNNKDENSYIGCTKIQESSSKEEIQNIYSEHLIDKSILILEKLYENLNQLVNKITRQPNKIDNIDGDTDDCWAFRIEFSDNGKYDKEHILSVIKENLNVYESHLDQNENFIIIWVSKEN